MKVGKFLILPLFLILVSSTFTVPAYSTEAEEDIQAGCREGETLIYRYSYNEYVCVEPSTAKRWVDLGMAEIVEESKPVDEEKEQERIQKQYDIAPPPPPPPESSEPLDSECRAGQTLVYRFTHQNTFCVSSSVAFSWERLGLVEILEHSEDVEAPYVEYSSEETLEESLEESSVEIESEEKISETFEESDTRKSTPILSKEFSLLDYPDQPSIHPKLEEANNFWSPPAVHQVNDRIWVAVGYDAANSIMIEGEKGIIIVDTLSTYEAAKTVLNEFRKITDKPVKAIIYTHGHLDHVHGTKAFLEEGDGAVEIIAHSSLLDFYINENSVLGPIASIRSAHAAGSLLPDEGPDRNNLGVFPKFQPGTIAFVPPNEVFDERMSLNISGVQMELVHVAGESSDQIYIWLPDDEALLIGDNVYAIFPNVYTLRGAVYRDPMDYVHALDLMIPLKPMHLVPSHVKPVSGYDEVMNILISTRDATQYIYDQTIRGMNMGYTADELSYMIELPDWFANDSWLTQSRGQIPWHVKQIYYGNLGWFQGDPTFLLPISDKERASKIIDAFGGIELTLQEAYSAIENGEYNWAAELTTYVLEVDSDNQDAKLLKAHALRVMGQRMLSADARHWSLTTALELEGKLTIDANSFTQTSPEQLAELPIEKILEYLPTKYNSEESENDEFILNLIYTDSGQTFTLHFRNGILAVLSGLHDEADHTLELDVQTHKLVVGGHMNLMDGIRSGQIHSDGSLEQLELFLGYIEPLTISSEGLHG